MLFAFIFGYTSIPVGCSSAHTSLPASPPYYYIIRRIIESYACRKSYSIHSHALLAVGTYLPFAFRSTLTETESSTKKKRKRKKPVHVHFDIGNIVSSSNMSFVARKSLSPLHRSLYALKLSHLVDRSIHTHSLSLSRPARSSFDPKTYYNINFCYLCAPCSSSVLYLASASRRVDSRTCYI